MQWERLSFGLNNKLKVTKIPRVNNHVSLNVHIVMWFIISRHILIIWGHHEVLSEINEAVHDAYIWPTWANETISMRFKYFQSGFLNACHKLLVQTGRPCFAVSIFCALTMKTQPLLSTGAFKNQQNIRVCCCNNIADPALRNDVKALSVRVSFCQSLKLFIIVLVLCLCDAY